MSIIIIALSSLVSVKPEVKQEQEVLSQGSENIEERNKLSEEKNSIPNPAPKSEWVCDPTYECGNRKEEDKRLSFPHRKYSEEFKIIFLADGEIFTTTIEGDVISQVTDTNHEITDFILSPDRKRFAYSVQAKEDTEQYEEVFQDVYNASFVMNTRLYEYDLVADNTQQVIKTKLEGNIDPRLESRLKSLRLLGYSSDGVKILYGSEGIRLLDTITKESVVVFPPTDHSFFMAGGIWDGKYASIKYTAGGSGYWDDIYRWDGYKLEELDHTFSNHWPGYKLIGFFPVHKAVVATVPDESKELPRLLLFDLEKLEYKEDFEVETTESWRSMSRVFGDKIYYIPDTSWDKKVELEEIDITGKVRQRFLMPPLGSNTRIRNFELNTSHTDIIFEVEEIPRFSSGSKYKVVRYNISSNKLNVVFFSKGFEIRKVAWL